MTGILLATDDFRALVAEARLAPSVHNIQPSRWRLQGGWISLLGDTARAIPVADPEGRDWRISHGAALEGMAMALAARGLAMANLKALDRPPESASGLQPILGFDVITGTRATTVDNAIIRRTSWRGAFNPVTAESNAALDRLAVLRDDLALLRGLAVKDMALLSDKAGLHFLRDSSHRAELLQWMRLSRGHADYHRDGLNAEMMQLGALEAFGAGLVLGPLFNVLDRLGLAGMLVSEAAKTVSAAAIAVLHRPDGEDTITSGRAFYAAWLAMETCGLQGAPLSVLADWDVARNELMQRCAIPAGRRIISAFRIGEPAAAPRTSHARLPVDELIVR
jgi:hypothetical protein